MALLKTKRISANTADDCGVRHLSAIRTESGRRDFLLRWLVVLQMVLGAFSISGAEPLLDLTEYRLKAPIIYNIAKYVEWPESAFANQNAPIILGILGKDPFGADLEDILLGQTLNGRKLILKRFTRVEDFTKCHILFISTSEENRLSEILKMIKGKPILTVGDMARFPERGGIVYLRMEALHVRFEINKSAATRASLKWKAQIFKYAKKIHTDPP